MPLLYDRALNDRYGPIGADMWIDEHLLETS